MTTTSQATSWGGATFPDMGEWAGAAELAFLLGVSRQRIQQLAQGKDFPRPIIELSMGKVWRTDDVRRWAVARGRETFD